MSDLAEPRVGDVLGPRVVRVTRETAVRYAGASTDFNPIHWSDDAARRLGLDGVIVHGMWTMGAAMSLVTEWAGGPDRVAGQSVRFTRPVPVPDTPDGTPVTITGTITEVTDELVTISLDARVGGQTVLGAARAQVRR